MHSLKLAALLTALALPALAQDPGRTPMGVGSPGVPPTPKQPAPSNAHIPTVSIDFPGGTLEAFVAALRQAAGSDQLNIVVPRNAADLPLPAISLKNTLVSTAINSMTYLVDRQMARLQTQRISDDGEALTFVLYCERVESMPGPFGPSGPAGQRNPRVSRVYAIRDLSEPPTGLSPTPELTVSYERILDVVKVAASLEAKEAADRSQSGGASEPTAELMLHKDSGLLIVRGTDNQQKLIDSVLDSLRSSIIPKRHEAMERARAAQQDELNELSRKAALEQAEIEVARAERELETQAVRLKQVEGLVAAGTESVNVLEAAKSDIAAAQENLRKARATMRGRQAEAELVAAQRKAGVAVTSVAFEQPITIVYDIADLVEMRADIYGMCEATIKSEWKTAIAGDDSVDSRWAILNSWKSSNAKAHLLATPAEHRVLVQYFNAVRRAKTNQPNLPGLDADALIRDASKKN